MSFRIRKRLKKCLSLVQNNAAFSMLEMAVTTALSSVVVVGVVMLFTDITKMQSQVRAQESITEVAARLRAALSDKKAWANTVNISLGGTTNLAFVCAANKDLNNGCTPTPTSATPLTSYPTFDSIQDGSTAPGVSLYSDNGTNGFNYAGSPCVGFSTATPNDACPFSYRLRFQFACPSTTSCLNPQITIWGFLEYSPATRTTISSINVAKYQIHVVKGVNTPRNDIIQVVEQVPWTGPPSGPISNNPSYICSGGGITRTFNTILADSACAGVVGGPNCNVLNVNPLRLVGGTYVCYGSATGYMVNGFSISVNKDGVPIPGVVSPVAYASAADQGIETATLANFTVTSTANFFTLQLVQQCQLTGTSPYALGLPLGFSGVYSTSNIYSGFYCTRIL